MCTQCEQFCNLAFIQDYHLICAVEKKLMLNFLKNCSALSHKDDTLILNVINLQNVMHKNGERKVFISIHKVTWMTVKICYNFA